MGDLGTLNLSVNWPYEISNGKWLLYLTEIEMTGTENQYCVPDGIIVNELNFTTNNQTSRPKRTKRDVAAAKELRKLITERSGESDLELECGNKHTARCKRFICPLRNMTKEAKITLRARLWNSTFLEEFQDYSRIYVNLEASLLLDTNISTIKMDQSNVNVTLNIQLKPDEKQFSNMKWVIVVAVLAGVLLLSFIILLLWKCGFFKRANTRAMYEAKEQKAEIKTQPSETKRLTDND